MWAALRIWLVVRLLLLACAFCGVACVPREVDIDAFASSAQVLAERTAFNVTCSTGCALAPLFERTLHHYDVLDRVFVVDWNGWPMNGLGNSLPHFSAQALTACLLSDRACFSQRNRAGNCSTHGEKCVRVDPGAYFGTWGGIDWRWGSAAMSQLVSTGARELVLHFSSHVAGFEDAASGALLVNGTQDVLSLLLHPAVRDAPWVTLRAPEIDSGSVVDQLWSRAAAPMKINSWWDGCFAGPPIEHAIKAALDANVTACSSGEARQCLSNFFLSPRPPLQRALLPHLVRLDAAHAANGSSVCIHVRSGYADFAATPQHEAPPSTAVVVNFTVEVEQESWHTLDDAFPSCPPSTSPPPPPPPPSPPSTSQSPDDTAPCLRFSDKALAAIRSSGTSCAARSGNNSTHTALAFLESEVDAGTPHGLVSSLLACAAAWAESGSARGDAPWLIYVAGDLPPLFLLANASAALRGHVTTAEGTLGHVSFASVCTGISTARTCTPMMEDPAGAWTRSFVDLYMLAACDRLLHLGSSSFVSTAMSRRHTPSDEEFWSWETIPATAMRVAMLTRSLKIETLTQALDGVAVTPSGNRPPPPQSRSASPPDVPHNISVVHVASPSGCGSAPQAQPAEVTLTPGSLWRGTLSYGERSLFATASARLLLSEPLRVLAIGGSLTCGAAHGNSSRPDRPHGLVSAWPSVLERLLNERVPVHSILTSNNTAGEKHTVTNVCSGGVASDFWVDAFAAWEHPADTNTPPIPSPFVGVPPFDVVVVETSINDVVELAESQHRDLHLSAEDRVQKYTELLLLQILSITPRPAVLWLTASSRGSPWIGGPRVSDAAWLHAPVMAHHGVHMVSLVDALGPFVTPTQQQFFSYDFRVDGWGHVTRLGQELNAALVMDTLLTVAADAQPMLQGEPISPYVPRVQLLKVTPADVAMYINGRPFSINLVQNGAAEYREPGESGWQAYEDVPGKRGYIANITGAHATWALSSDIVAAHVLTGTLHFTSLESYEQMGKLRVDAEAGTWAENACRAGTTVASTTVDGLTMDRVSISVVHEMTFDVSALRQPSTCMRITATIVASEPPRQENKAKLMSIVVF